MKRIIILIMVLSVLFCACAKEGNKEIVSDSAVMESAVSDDAAEVAKKEEEANEDVKVNEANELIPDPAMTVTMAKKDKPMLSDKVDLTQKGIEMVCYSDFATGPIKGDDGNCYYFRYQGKKERKITFYKNNAIKVCETVLPKKYVKDWYIFTFFKQGEQFWIQLVSDEYSDQILIPVQIKDGKWGKGIKKHWQMRLIYYKDCFYFFDEYDGMVDIIDMKGNKKSLKFAEEERWATLQAIIDDKFYYVIEESDGNNIVMRCNMDGSDKEELFQYSNVYDTSGSECRLTMDEDFLYLFSPYCGFTLTRIPLYGGEVEKIVATDWYELTEDSIYYLDEMGNICRVNKDLKGRPEIVTLRDEYPSEEPLFLCADGHLLVERYNEEEMNIIDEILYMDDHGIISDINMNYSSEYYWVAENGEVEDTIPGSGLKKKYYECYELANQNQGISEENLKIGNYLFNSEQMDTIEISGEDLLKRKRVEISTEIKAGTNMELVIKRDDVGEGISLAVFRGNHGVDLGGNLGKSVGIGRGAKEGFYYQMAAYDFNHDGEKEIVVVAGNKKDILELHVFELDSNLELDLRNNPKLLVEINEGSMSYVNEKDEICIINPNGDISVYSYRESEV